MKADSSSSPDKNRGSPQNDRTSPLCHSERLVLPSALRLRLEESQVEGSEESTLSFVASELVSDGFSPWASQVATNTNKKGLDSIERGRKTLQGKPSG